MSEAIFYAANITPNIVHTSASHKNNVYLAMRLHITPTFRYISKEDYEKSSIFCRDYDRGF